MKKIVFDKRLVPLLFFVSAVLLIFSPWWIQGKVLAPLDIITNLYEPWANPDQPVQVKNHFATDAPEQYLLYHHHANLSYQTEGRWGWNYLKHGGTPAFQNTMATPGDWSLQLHRLLPFWTSWHLGIMGHILIAMFGMYRLLRGHLIRRDLCILGGLAFGLNAQFFAWIYHRWTLGAFCWTPWWLWAMLQLKHQKRAGLLAPFFLSLSLLGGHLQFVAYQLIILGIFTIDWLLENHHAKRGLIKPLLTALTVAVLAFGLAAFSLIPSSVGYFNTLAAGLKRGLFGYPQGFINAIRSAFAYPAYVFPFPFGIPQTLDIFKLLGANLLDVPFFGSLLMCFALIGMFYQRLPRLARWLSLAGLLLPMTPLLGPLYRRVLILWIIGGVWLAITVLHSIDSFHLYHIRKWLLRAFLVATIMLGVGGLGVQAYHPRITNIIAERFVKESQDHRFQARPDWFADRAELFVSEWKPWRPAMAIPWLLFGASIFILAYRHYPWFGYALILLIVPQIWMYSHQCWISFHRPFGPESSIFPHTVETKAIRRIVGSRGRVQVLRPADRLPLFPPNSLSYFEIPSLEGYDSIVPVGMQLKSLSEGTRAEDLGSLGVTHTITFAEPPPPGQGWQFVESAGKIAIFSNFYASAWYKAVLETEDVPVQIEIHQHNRRRLRLPQGTRQVRILENWDPGWRWHIEGGTWNKMLKRNDNSMWANLSDESIIEDSAFEMQYQPKLLFYSKMISFCTLIVLSFSYFLLSILQRQRLRHLIMANPPSSNGL